MAQFEVQTVDPGTGAESWALVSARTADEARNRVAETGMMTGIVKLKTMDEAPSPPTRTEKAGHRSDCPACGTELIPRGRGIHGFNETITCTVLLMLGLIPGILYYIGVEARPYCPKCERRI